MPRFFRTTGVARAALASMRRVLLLFVLLPALARADVAIYEALVPLQGSTAADRAAGFAEALRVAAVRASGRRDAAANPVVAAAAANPAKYVQQYEMTSDRMLKVGFDGRSVEQLLQQAGLPLWPAERPVTLVELFLPSVAGGVRAVLASEHPAERAAAERAALVRGLPIAWPQQAIDLEHARDRAPGATQAVLVGVGGGTELAWTFTQADLAAQGQGPVEAGIDVAADALATRYAPASTRGLNTVPVSIGGVGDLHAYAGLLEYLRSLSLVRGVAVEELAGDTVRLRLVLRGDLELLRRIAALDKHLQPGARDANAADATSAAATDFTWQP